MRKEQLACVPEIANGILKILNRDCVWRQRNKQEPDDLRHVQHHQRRLGRGLLPSHGISINIGLSQRVIAISCRDHPGIVVVQDHEGRPSRDHVLTSSFSCGPKSETVSEKV